MTPLIKEIIEGIINEEIGKIERHDPVLERPGVL
jgi:hypothetical protein